MAADGRRSAATSDEEPDLPRTPEPLAVEARIPQLVVEALGTAVMPRTPGRDERTSDVLVAQPPHGRVGCELSAVVPSDENGLA